MQRFDFGSGVDGVGIVGAVVVGVVVDNAVDGVKVVVVIDVTAGAVVVVYVVGFDIWNASPVAVFRSACFVLSGGPRDHAV